MCTTVADSYVTTASQLVGSVAKQAANRKSMKFAELSATDEFQPVAVESHRPSNDSTTHLRFVFFQTLDTMAVHFQNVRGDMNINNGSIDVHYQRISFSD